MIQLYNMSVLACCVQVATLFWLMHFDHFYLILQILSTLQPMYTWSGSEIHSSHHHLICFKTKYACPLGGSSMDGFSAIKMTALGRPQFLVGTKGWLKGQCTNLADSLHHTPSAKVTSCFCTAPVLRGPGEMAAIFHLPGITAGERWHGGLKAEAGAETTAGGVFHLLFSWRTLIIVVHM